MTEGVAKTSPGGRIDEIDQLLFEAGVLALSAKNKRDRAATDRKIMDARIRLEQLRPWVP